MTDQIVKNPVDYNKNPADDGNFNKAKQGQLQIPIGAEKQNLYRVREPVTKVDAKNTQSIYGQTSKERKAARQQVFDVHMPWANSARPGGFAHT